MLINGTKVTDLQSAVLDQLSSLPSSFPEYISSKPYYIPSPEVNKLLSEGAALCTNGKSIEGLVKLKQAIKETPTNYPNNPFLANLYHHTAVAYQNTGDYSKAIENMNKRIDILYESKDHFGTEQACKDLAQIHSQKGTLNQHHKTNLNTLSKSLRNDDQQLQLRTRLMLGAIERTQGNHEEALNHYSAAYDLQQGHIDRDAIRVEQREVGFSNQKIGTDNIQQCVAVIIHDPVTKRTALAHVDIHTDTKSLNDVIEKFPNNTNLNAYLVGGRDRSSQNKGISDSNIARVTNELQKHANINIKSADIGDKGAPSGVVFDPQTAQLSHAVPGKIHESTSVRKLMYNLTPQLNFAFDLTKSSEIIGPKLSQQDKENIVKSFMDTPRLTKTGTSEAWNSNIIYDPLAKTVEQIRKTNPQIILKVFKENVDQKLTQKDPQFRTLDHQFKEQVKHDLMTSIQKSLQDSKKSLSQIQQETDTTINMKANIGKQFTVHRKTEKIDTASVPTSAIKSINMPSGSTSLHTPNKKTSIKSNIIEAARGIALSMFNKLSNRNIGKGSLDNAPNYSETIKKADQTINIENSANGKLESAHVKWQTSNKAMQDISVKASNFGKISITSHRLKNNQKNGITR